MKVAECYADSSSLDLISSYTLQVVELLNELGEMKSSGTAEAKSRQSSIELGVSELRGFADSATELRTKGSPCDIISRAAELRARASQLLETHVVSRDQLAPVAFDPMNIDELTRCEQNLVGRLRRVTGSGICGA